MFVLDHPVILTMDQGNQNWYERKTLDTGYHPALSQESYLNAIPENTNIKVLY